MYTATQMAIIPFSLISIFGSEAPIEQPALAQRELSMENRYPEPWVNSVFKDNILLNLHYLSGSVKSKEDINWDNVLKPATFEFRLDPKQTFAYHDDVDQKYKQSFSASKDTLVKTTNAHFNAAEGFKSDGYLFGDGVCHLASLIYWAAKDAGLEAQAPTNHDFRAIPDVPREYGVSIYSNPFSTGSHTQQNLYITNNREKTITFKFEYDGAKVKVSISEN